MGYCEGAACVSGKTQSAICAAFFFMCPNNHIRLTKSYLYIPTWVNNLKIVIRILIILNYKEVVGLFLCLIGVESPAALICCGWKWKARRGEAHRARGSGAEGTKTPLPRCTVWLSPEDLKRTAALSSLLSINTL